MKGDQTVECCSAPEAMSVQPSLRFRGYKRVLISLYQQWLMNRHKTKVNNIFEVGKVYCERKTFSSLT